MQMRSTDAGASRSEPRRWKLCCVSPTHDIGQIAISAWPAIIKKIAGPAGTKSHGAGDWGGRDMSHDHHHHSDSGDGGDWGGGDAGGGSDGGGGE